MRPVAAELLERIRREGEVKGEVVKVDRFLNHQVDPQLVGRIGIDLAARFAGTQVDKVITAETSGIMLAQAVALELGVPFIYAKKKRPLTMSAAFSAASYSFTKQEQTELFVSREVLATGERLLFVDDFLAAGSALKAIEEIAAQAGAELVGRAVIIDKAGREDVEAILQLRDLSALSSPPLEGGD